MGTKRKLLQSLCGLLLVFTLCFSPFASAIAAASGVVGNECFETLREEFPNIWDGSGVTQPVFGLSSSDMITEEVWIELPLESLATGQKDEAKDVRDLIAIRITRQKAAAEAGIKVPVILEHSPYRGNNLSNEEYVNAVSRYHPNTEDPRRQTPEFGVNPDTSDSSYDDIKSLRLALSDWPWDDDAHDDPYYHIPASRGEKPEAQANKFTSGHLVSGGNLNAANYMFARGFARINSSMGGNRYGLSSSSATAGPFNDGLNTYGETYEMLAGLAVIKWLNGECRAYKDKSAEYEVKADWASGDVVMMGTSYNGTTCMGVASAGDPHLRAIIPVAGLSIMYEYFRTNGTVYPWSQGEDVEWLSRYDMARWSDPNFAPGTEDRILYENILARIVEESSHETGDYNQFWDMSNWVKDATKYKAAVLFTQGQQDRNVGTQHFDQLYRALKTVDPDYPIKILLHLSGHTTMWNAGPPDWLGVYHKWLDHFVYGIDNGIERDGVEAYVADSATGEWHEYSSWPAPEAKTKRYYFVQNDDGGGQLATRVPPAVVEGPFFDQLKYRVEADMYDDPSDRFYNDKPYPSNLYNGVVNQWYSTNEWLHDSWEATMLFPESSSPITVLPDAMRSGSPRTNRPWSAFGQHPWPQHRSQMANVRVDDMDEILKHTDARLAYISEPLTQDVTLSGVAKISMNITPDKGVGNLSAMIVDLGEANRHFTLVNDPSYRVPAAGGINAYNRQVYEFYDYLTQYHVVARSSVDVQNPNPSGITYLDTDATRNTGFMPPFTWQTKEIVPGNTYRYSFTLEPRQYTFREGHRLAVVIYTTDYKHTQRPPEATKMELQLGAQSYIELPIIGDLAVAAAKPDQETVSKTGIWYRISASAGAGGTISPSGDVMVEESGDQNFAFTPEPGYVIEDVLVDGQSVGASEGYSFRHVAKPHTIEVVFGPKKDNPFVDVTENDWFFGPVLDSYYKGFMVGTTAVTFDPQGVTTRAMIPTILYRMEGSPAITQSTMFSDVEPGLWYSNGIIWAAENEIVLGQGDGTFSPNAPITREQLAAMLYRFATYKRLDLGSEGDLSAFADGDQVSLWALDAVRWAVGSGLMKGKGEGILDPLGGATRAETSTMLMNFVARYPEGL